MKGRVKRRGAWQLRPPRRQPRGGQHMTGIGCVCHGTRTEFLASILAHGLMPGGPRGASASSRNDVHFSCAPPWEGGDAAKRFHDTANAFVFLQRTSVRPVDSHNAATISQNGVMLADFEVPPDIIDCVWRHHDGHFWPVWHHRAPATPPQGIYLPGRSSAPTPAEFVPGVVPLDPSAPHGVFENHSFGWVLLDRRI